MFALWIINILYIIDSSTRIFKLSSALKQPGGGISETVASELRTAILGGRLAAGTQLRQDHIAAQYNVSHIPVREALRRLEAEGLVTHYPRRGTFVSRLSADECQDVTDMRRVLEVLAVELSVPQAGDEDLDRATQVLEAADRSASLDDWSRLNWQFHQTLYAPCGRPRLLKTIEGLWQTVDRYLRVVWQTADYQECSQREHWDILGAYRRGDTTWAAELVAAHVDDAGTVLQRFMERAESAED